ncbi:MAG: DUF4349 domain-containing protein [Euryarchaeota archaeon]|nr:DUF4349 domain-containing protein [Euryarchaeota archaeon]
MNVRRLGNIFEGFIYPGGKVVVSTMRELAVVAVLLLAAGCALKPPEAVAPLQAEDGPGGERLMQLSVEEKAVAAISPSASGRRVIKEAQLGLEVQDLDAAMSQLEELAVAANGYVFGSSIYTLPSGQRRGTVTLEIPAGSFEATLGRIRELGKVLHFSTSGRDVTEEFIDLEARLRNLKRQEERLLELLDRAESVKDVLEVERELWRIRGEVERLEGRLRYLERRTEMARVSVELSEPEPITASLGLRSALREALEGIAKVTRWMIVAAGYLLPPAALAALLLLLLGRLRRG